jgi:hypothetical protein
MATWISPGYAALVGTNVFIGHGRSPLWRELKDFIKDRLSLHVDEFNSVPVAGISTSDRLSELLDSAAMAFLVMTAEDEHADNKLYARLASTSSMKSAFFKDDLGSRVRSSSLRRGARIFQTSTA